MKIHTLRRTEYKGIHVYIMQFGDCFQYLFPYEGQIYMEHVKAPVSLYIKVLWMLGFIKTDTPYTDKQLSDFESLLMSGATVSIDELMGNKPANPVIVPAKEKQIPLEK